MKIISTNDVRDWFLRSNDLAEFTRTIGTPDGDTDGLGPAIDIPPYFQFTIERRAREVEGPVPHDVFDSISFFSLCKGLFLPLSGLTPDRVATLFGLTTTHSTEKPIDLARRFLAKEIGLSTEQKVACLLGDPFLGKKGTFRRDSLIRLLRSTRLIARNTILDRLTQVGEVAILFAESTTNIKGDPPLTSLEVLETLRFLPPERLTKKMVVLSSLIARCGRMERYFLARLLLRNAGFGFEYQGPILVQLLAEKYKADPDQLEHAMALTSPLTVARTLDGEGVAGLRAIQLKPLSAIRPALAGGTVEDIKKYPVWVERKYDGIRLQLHKSTDGRGSVLCGAYTRNRGDWLELIPGLPATIPLIPARDAIVDGELFGTVVDLDGPRPASVYEVYCMIQGEPVRPVQLKFAAFDLLYMNGTDLTGLPLSTRRQYLTGLIAPLVHMPMPLAVTLSEGQMADSREDLNRLFNHFRAQGYEGIIAKDWGGAYHLATRDPSWAKRKPEITLDLVILGGVLAVTSKENAGLFGSYVVAAKNAKGGYDIVGDVAGLDRVRDQQIQSDVMRRGLMTGRRIERASASGVRPGIEFLPAIVVTVRFEGIIRHERDGVLSLRDPKIVFVRSDKAAWEVDDVAMLERLYIDQRIG